MAAISTTQVTTTVAAIAAFTPAPAPANAASTPAAAAAAAAAPAPASAAALTSAKLDSLLKHAYLGGVLCEDVNCKKLNCKSVHIGVVSDSFDYSGVQAWLKIPEIKALIRKKLLERANEHLAQSRPDIKRLSVDYEGDLPICYADPACGIHAFFDTIFRRG